MTDTPSSSETVTCAYPSEVGDGQPCGFAAESVVDVVRSEGDGSSTFFTLPTCLGHRLALGEHVIVFGPVPHAPDDRLAP